MRARILVVGAGIVGILAAVECAAAGALVHLVEQKAIPAPSAASNDWLRVVRSLHRGDPALTRAAARVPGDWAAVERRFGGRFYHQTGVLTVLPPGGVDTEVRSLADAGVRAEVLAAGSLAGRYPHVRFVAGREAILEPLAGTVRADQSLRAAVRWLRGQPGVRIHQHSRAQDVGEAATVRLSDGSTLTGDAVIVAAGPWSRALLPPSLAARLTLQRQTVLSYRPTSLRSSWSASPAMLGLGGSDDAWLMPPAAGAPARLSAASACRSAWTISDAAAPAESREHLIRTFGDVLTGFDESSVSAATQGHFLVADADAGPLLAELGDAVWAYAACGGMSFKFAPAVARALADRALGRAVRQTGLRSVDRPRRPNTIHS